MSIFMVVNLFSSCFVFISICCMQLLFISLEILFI